MNIKSMLEEAHNFVSEIKEITDTLAEQLKGKPISRDLENAFSSFNQKLDIYSKAISDENSNPQTIIDSVKMIAVYGTSISQQIQSNSDSNSNINSLKKELLTKSQYLQTWSTDRPELRKIFQGETVQLARLGDFIVPRTPTEIEQSQKEALSEVEKKLLEMSNDLKLIQKKYKEEQKELLEKYENKISKTEKTVNDIETKAIEKLKNVDKIYNEKLKLIKEKEKEINDLLGIVSENTISGNFEDSAEEEKKLANGLRYTALSGMLIITTIVGYSFFDSIHSFSWEESIFRFVLVIFLSIPTTYLARESAKHRKQQYKHLQMSLELKATTPYWNSLPKEDQDKLKVELSKKIFAQNNDSAKEIDSFPLNTQELISQLINKIPSVNKD